MRAWNCAVCNQDFDSIFKKSSTLSKSQQKLWKIFCDYFINSCKSREDGNRRHNIHGVQSATKGSPNKNSNHDNKSSLVNFNLDLKSTNSQFFFTPFCPDCQLNIEELCRLDTLLGEIHQQIKTVSANISATLVQSFDPSSSSTTTSTATGDNDNDENNCQTTQNRKKYNEDVQFTRQVNTIIKDTRRTIYQNYQPFVLLRSDNDDKISDGTARNEIYNVSESDDNAYLLLPQPPSVDTLIKPEHVSTEIFEAIPSTSSPPKNCSSPSPIIISACTIKPTSQEISSTNNSDDGDSRNSNIVSFDCVEVPMQDESESPDYGFFMDCSGDGDEDEEVIQDYQYDCEDETREDENDEYLQQYFSDKESQNNSIIVHNSSLSSASGEDCIAIVDEVDDDNDSNQAVINDAHITEDFQQYNNIAISSNANTQPTSIGFTQVDEITQETQQTEVSKHLIMSVDEIQSLTLEEILERLSGYNITPEQISMIKKIRRKERNKISAKQSRQRSYQRFSQLHQELNKLKGENSNTNITHTQEIRRVASFQLPIETAVTTCPRTTTKSTPKKITPIPQTISSLSSPFKDKDCILVDDDSVTESEFNDYSRTNDTQFSNDRSETETTCVIQFEGGIQVSDPRSSHSETLIMTEEEIQSLSLNEIFIRISPYNLSQDQISLIRKTRRKAKNKICARQSRARFQSRVNQLQLEVDMCKKRKSGLISERKQLLLERDKLDENYKVLYQAIIQGLLTKSGADANTNPMDYCLKELKNGEFALRLKKHHIFNPTGALDLTLNETTDDHQTVGMDLSVSNLNYTTTTTTAVKIEYD